MENRFDPDVFNKKLDDFEEFMNENDTKTKADLSELGGKIEEMEKKCGDDAAENEKEA